MKAFTNEEIYRLYEEEDSALLDLLDTMEDDSIIEVIKYFTNLNYKDYRYFINTLGHYLNHRILFNAIK